MSDVIHQSVYELVHTEDRHEFQKQLHWALNSCCTPDGRQLVQASPDATLTQTYYTPEQLPPENFLERNFACRLRCLLDSSSGFLTMNFQGCLKFLYGQNERTADGKPIPVQLALFALACPLQPPSILEILTKSLMFQTKHKLDFMPIACDAKGSVVLGYTEAELCNSGSGYQYIHAADMLYCAENHMRVMRMGESGLTVFRLLTKQNLWVWIQSNARLIYKNGQPDCIIASQRVLTDEEGEENLRKRAVMLPFSFTTGEAVLYDMNQPRSLGNNTSSDPASLDDNLQTRITRPVDPDSLLGSMLKQDKSIYLRPGDEHSVLEQGLGNKDLGGIFTTNSQESIFSVSESPLFKQKPVFTSEGDDCCDILKFMASLGISTEDLKFLQQDGRNDRAHLTDGILSYVQQSLRTNMDYIVSDGNVMEQELTRGPIQTLIPNDSCDPLALVPQEQQITFITEETEAKIQNLTQTQPQTPQRTIPDLQKDPHGHQHKMSQSYNWAGITQLSHNTNGTRSQQSQCSNLPPFHQQMCKTFRSPLVCENMTEVLDSDILYSRFFHSSSQSSYASIWGCPLWIFTETISTLCP